MALVDEGDSIWLVWRPSTAQALRYPCKVLKVIRAAHSSTLVRLRFLQSNGYLDEDDDFQLAKAKLRGEADMKSRDRVHLDWAYRMQGVGEPDYQMSGYARDPRKRQQADVPPQDGQTGRRLETMETALSNLQAEVAALAGKFDAWDVTVSRMAEYQRQMGTLMEEIRKLKKAVGVDATLAEAAAGAAADFEAPMSMSMSMSRSDPVCAKCKRAVAYDMPLRSLLDVMAGDDRVEMADLFTDLGMVRANSPLKKLVQCGSCLEAGATRVVVCTSGGAGGKLACDWCRTSMTTKTTDAKSCWCGSKHSDCRGLCIENETDRQRNSFFLRKGLEVPVRHAVPWDSVTLIDTDLSEQWNDADYIMTATRSDSSMKALVILEVDNRSHAASMYTPANERVKNDGSFAAGASKSFDKILFVRINPAGEFATADEGMLNTDKRARWLILREWVATFLRYPYGAWAFEDKTLLYLFYDQTSSLIDRRPEKFQTVVTNRAPALPEGSSLADWACTLDPYLLMKGSQIAREVLALNSRLPQE